MCTEALFIIICSKAQKRSKAKKEKEHRHTRVTKEEEEEEEAKKKKKKTREKKRERDVSGQKKVHATTTRENYFTRLSLLSLLSSR